MAKGLAMLALIGWVIYIFTVTGAFETLFEHFKEIVNGKERT